MQKRKTKTENKLKLQLWEWRSELLVPGFGDFKNLEPEDLGYLCPALKMGYKSNCGLHSCAVSEAVSPA